MQATRKIERALMLAICLAVLPQSYGCSAGGWYGELFGDKATEKAEGARESESAEPYFTASAGVKLYAEPHFSAAVIATLPRFQKVYRYRQQSGFAYVEVEHSGQTGWLENAKLIWRLPGTAAKPPAGGGETTTTPATQRAPGAEKTPLPADAETAPAPAGEKDVRAPADVGDAEPAGGDATAGGDDEAPADSAEEAPPDDEDEVSPSRFDLF